MIQKVAVVFVLLLLLLLMPASAQSASDIADQHKKILDTYSKVIDTVNYNGSTYHIIKYYNVFPYADGIEIITAEGLLVTDPAIAQSVFTQSAWKTAAIQFKQYDIAALQGINNTLIGNDCSWNDKGISINGFNNSLIRNNFTYNQGYGLDLYGGSNCTFLENLIAFNLNGLKIIVSTPPPNIE